MKTHGNWWRPFAAAVCSAALCLTLGCGGGDDDKAAAKDGAQVAPSDPAEKEPAQKPPAQPATTRLAAVADAKTVDDFVAPYVTGDHALAIVVEPGRVIDAAVLAPFQELRENLLEGLSREAPLDPLKIERVAVLMPLPPEGLFGEVPSGPRRPVGPAEPFDPEGLPIPEDVPNGAAFPEPAPEGAPVPDSDGAAAIDGAAFERAATQPVALLAQAAEPADRNVAELVDEPGATPSPKEPVEIAIIVRFLEDVNDEPLQAMLKYEKPAERKEHNSRAWFQAPLQPAYRFENPVFDDEGDPVFENGEQKFEVVEGPLLPVGPSYFRVDARTVVFGKEEFIPKLLDNKPAPSPLRKLLAGVHVGNGLVIAGHVGGHEKTADAFRERFRKEAEFAPPPVQMAVPFAESLQSVLLVADLSAPTTLHVAFEMRDADAAKQLAETGDQGVKQIQAMFGEMRKGLEENPEAVPYLQGGDLKEGLELAGRLLDGLSVKRDGDTRVVGELKRPAGLDEFVKAKAAPVVEEMRAAAQRTNKANNMKQMGIVLHAYHGIYGTFPAAAPRYDEKEPGRTSWRVSVLEQLDERQLFREYDFEQPWDSEANKPFLARMPGTYADPSKLGDKEDGKTRIALVTGPGTAWEKAPEGLTIGTGRTPRISQFSDGTSNTIMLVELPAEKAVPWTQPADFVLDPDDPLKGLQPIPEEGLLCVMGDGSILRIPPDIKPEDFKALCTHAGGEVVFPSKVLIGP